MRKNRLETDIHMGEKYRDTVSGFEGTATAIYFFMNGCERVQLEKYDTAQAKLLELTFDAPRLVHIPSGKQATTTRTGGYKPDPPRRGAAR